MRCSKCSNEATHVAVEFVDEVLSVPMNVEHGKFVNRFYCDAHFRHRDVLMIRKYTYKQEGKIYKGRVIPLRDWEVLVIKSTL